MAQILFYDLTVNTNRKQCKWHLPVGSIFWATIRRILGFDK
jgi:hypothetical protein